MSQNRNLENEKFEINWAFNDFVVRASYLCLNEIEASHKRNLTVMKFADEAIFLKEVLEELKYVDTKKGDELWSVLTRDKQLSLNGASRRQDFYTEEISTRANFIYLQSLFERLVKKIFRYGCTINREFDDQLKQRLTKVYKRDIKNGRESKDLEEVLIRSSNADLSQHVDKLDYPPLYNLIEILNLRKGVFKEFIEISYMLDVYRVTRNAIAHRSGYFDDTFFSELDNINGVKGRLGDSKNQKFRKSLIKKLVGKFDFSTDEDLKDRFIHLGYRDFIFCFSNFTQLALISIGLISKDKDNLSDMIATFSGEAIHSLLLTNLETNTNTPLFIGKQMIDDISITVRLINAAIDKERELQKQELEDYVHKDVHLANLIFLHHELYLVSGETKDQEATNEYVKSSFEAITDSLIKDLVKSVLDHNPFDLYDVLNKIKDSGLYKSLDTWYSVRKFESHPKIKVFIKTYKREQRISDALEYLKRKKLSKS